jgi:hypothetical protein
MRKPLLLIPFILTLTLFLWTGCDNSDSPDDFTEEVIMDMSKANYSQISGAREVVPDGCTTGIILNNSCELVSNYYSSPKSEMLWRFSELGSDPTYQSVTISKNHEWKDAMRIAEGQFYLGACFDTDYRIDEDRTWYNRRAGITYALLYIESISYDPGAESAQMFHVSPIKTATKAKTIQLSEEDVYLTPNNNNSMLVSISPYNAGWSVTSSESWCEVKTTGLDSFTVFADASTSEKSCILTIKVEGLPDKIINVSQGTGN